MDALNIALHPKICLINDSRIPYEYTGVRDIYYTLLYLYTILYTILYILYTIIYIILYMYGVRFATVDCSMRISYCLSECQC